MLAVPSATPRPSTTFPPRRLGIRRFLRLLLCAALLATLPLGSAHAQAPAHARHFVAAAANPLAAQAGRDILARGGNAVDAAIAMQMVLNLVEPQSSGIGGGGFLLYYDAKTKKVTAFDGRETAPASASPAMFLHPDGTPMGFYEAAVGGLSVGVPGVLAMLEAAHAKFGKLPWGDLFQPAIDLAEKGFRVSPRLHKLIARDRYLKTSPESASYFYDARGMPLAVGALLKNPKLAYVLRQIAAQGARAFYTGKIAQDIVNAISSARTNPGHMTLADLKAYHADSEDALCGPYRTYIVCGMPLPSSGAITMLQMLTILQDRNFAALPPGSLAAIHLILEASKLAFADRNQYLGDPNFVKVPVKAMLDPAYLRSRAALIAPGKSMGKAKPGDVEKTGAWNYAPSPAAEMPSTSHISVVDSDGNAVAYTTSIENAFGSRQMVDGFLLNNQLTDFSFVPVRDGRPVANAPAPLKHPLSAMSPTIVLDRNHNLVLSVGSPGGPAIIGFVLKTLLANLDWHFNIARAVAYPNFVNLNGKSRLEAGTPIVKLAPALEKMGDKVEIRPMVSGIQAIAVTPNGYEGAADPRREGVALGE